ncbi:hypothetical protein [Lysinibacillus sp. NPDC093688]|uniref:hypothetical protein n=1 Tax=Lysinibacillus sp. NPDC093688 TaxID=3390577 RepID=UPI003D07540E
MAKVLDISGYGLTVTGFVAMLKKPNCKQLQSVLDDCAKRKGYSYSNNYRIGGVCRLEWQQYYLFNTNNIFVPLI